MPAPDYSLDADITRIDPDPSDRTDARDEAADAIVELWPAHLTEIAEASGYSRQHVKNTLETYFEIDQPGQQDSRTFSLEVTVPDDVDRESYIRGYLAGQLDEDRR